MPSLPPPNMSGGARPDPPEAPGVTGYRQPPLRYRGGRGQVGGQPGHFSGRGGGRGYRGGRGGRSSGFNQDKNQGTYYGPTLMQQVVQPQLQSMGQTPNQGQIMFQGQPMMQGLPILQGQALLQGQMVPLGMSLQPIPGTNAEQTQAIMQNYLLLMQQQGQTQGLSEW